MRSILLALAAVALTVPCSAQIVTRFGPVDRAWAGVFHAEVMALPRISARVFPPGSTGGGLGAIASSPELALTRLAPLIKALKRHGYSLATVMGISPNAQRKLIDRDDIIALADDFVDSKVSGALARAELAQSAPAVAAAYDDLQAMTLYEGYSPGGDLRTKIELGLHALKAKAALTDAQGLARALAPQPGGGTDGSVLAEIRALQQRVPANRSELTAISERVVALVASSHAGDAAAQSAAVRAQIALAERSLSRLPGDEVGSGPEDIRKFLERAAGIAKASRSDNVSILFMHAAFDNLAAAKNPRAYSTMVAWMAAGLAAGSSQAVKEEAAALITRELADAPVAADLLSAMDQVRASADQPLRVVAAPRKSVAETDFQGKAGVGVVLGSLAAMMATVFGHILGGVSLDVANLGVLLGVVVAILGTFVALAAVNRAAPWYRDPDGVPPARP